MVEFAVGLVVVMSSLDRSLKKVIQNRWHPLQTTPINEINHNLSETEPPPNPLSSYPHQSRPPSRLPSRLPSPPTRNTFTELHDSRDHGHHVAEELFPHRRGWGHDLPVNLPSVAVGCRRVTVGIAGSSHTLHFLHHGRLVHSTGELSVAILESFHYNFTR